MNSFTTFTVAVLLIISCTHGRQDNLSNLMKVTTAAMSRSKDAVTAKQDALEAQMACNEMDSNQYQIPGSFPSRTKAECAEIQENVKSKQIEFEKAEVNVSDCFKRIEAAINETKDSQAAVVVSANEYLVKYKTVKEAADAIAKAVKEAADAIDKAVQETPADNVKSSAAGVMFALAAVLPIAALCL